MDPKNVRLPSHLRALDGLRGFACLAVVAHHCYFSAGRYTWPLGLPRLFSYGYLGVEIFFVLSGFCLAYPLLKQPDRPDDWARYARHRVRRIFPPYWAAYLLFFALSLLIYWQQIEPLMQTRLLALPSFRQFLYTFFLVAVWFNPAFWTLTVEARWYAIFPLCIKIARRFGAGLLLLSAIIGSAVFALVENQLSGRVRFVVGPLPLFLPLFVMGHNFGRVLCAPPDGDSVLDCPGQPSCSTSPPAPFCFGKRRRIPRQISTFTESSPVDCSPPA